MTLYLYEFSLRRNDHVDVDRVLKEIDAAFQGAGELIEAQVTGATVTATTQRVFLIAEFPSGRPQELDPQALDVADVSGPHQVRLVGAQLADLKAARPAAGYLVEWDLPAELDMDSYLDRKKANAPKYANVPEVSFLRTYVREDMDKCLCFYDAPDEDAVRRARDAVQTPVDRLYRLESLGR